MDKTFFLYIDGCVLVKDDVLKNFFSVFLYNSYYPLNNNNNNNNNNNQDRRRRLKKSLVQYGCSSSSIADCKCVLNVRFFSSSTFMKRFSF